jgi:hypothetical protein
MIKAQYKTLAVFITISLVFAQTGASAEKRGTAGRTAWFACTAIPDGFTPPVKVTSGSEITELELPEFMTSKAVKIPAGGVLRILKETANQANPAKPHLHILAEATVPENISEALIILSPLPAPKGHLLFSSKVQDLSKFKGGDRLFINFSNSNIRVRMGEEKVSIAPRQASIYESPKLAEPKNVPIMYEFFHPERKQWKILSASTVVLRPTRREICIFNNGTRLGNIKKHSILFPLEIQKPTTE